MRVREWPHCFICLQFWKRERIGLNVTRMVGPTQRPCCGAYMHDQCLAVHWMTTQPRPMCPWCGKRDCVSRGPPEDRTPTLNIPLGWIHASSHGQFVNGTPEDRTGQGQDPGTF